MNPPFLGTRIHDDIAAERVIELIDRNVLFAARWQLKGDLHGPAWAERVHEVAVPAFERMVQLCLAKRLLLPAAVRGYFTCEKKGNLLFVRDDRRQFAFDFPRERTSPHRCLADFFPDGFVAMTLVTVGGAVASAAAHLFKDNRYADVFYLKGFAAEATEALAKFVQREMARELGLDGDAGVRFSFGYPACPDLMDQKKLFDLLRGDRIELALSKTMHLIPEYATSAVVSFDPHAARFVP